MSKRRHKTSEADWRGGTGKPQVTYNEPVKYSLKVGKSLGWLLVAIVLGVTAMEAWRVLA